jgi:glycine dehydrogenase
LSSQQSPRAPLPSAAAEPQASPFSAPATDLFADRHNGPRDGEVTAMLRTLGCASLEDLVAQTVPPSIRLAGNIDLPAALTEQEFLARARALAGQNRVLRSFIGMGYHDCFTPPVIQRNILENPGWYTAYTPYQAEISQGRLEALLNFQTMIMDLTGFDVAGASLLDEGTAAAEAMQMLAGLHDDDAAATFFVSNECHPQTIAVLEQRAMPRAIKVVVGDHRTFTFDRNVFGALVQYPATDGTIHDYRGFIERAHAAGAKVAMAVDLLALVLLTPPGELGADVAIGSAQRFGVPMGYGGPHAAFIAAKKEHTRKLPGRLIGVSQDAQGRTALRMALQTREQHIRREKATSNICTAQVLLAVMASMYAVYHGPDGIRAIANRVAGLAGALARALEKLGLGVAAGPYFDTIRIDASESAVAGHLARAVAGGMNFRRLAPTTLTISLDETTSPADLDAIVAVFAAGQGDKPDAKPAVPATADRRVLHATPPTALPPALVRHSGFLTHPVWNSHHSETEMLRYIRRLESKDVSLTRSMIPLGSCTMKLNATSEMMPVTWREWGQLHPFAPVDQAQGYQAMFAELSRALSAVTGFPGVSLQPNAGSQGELAGLLVIRQYHESRGQAHRTVCLIPSSAHGTNPASAVMAGYTVVVVKCDNQGNVDLTDLEAQAALHHERLAALMITYPSTHGVFEEEAKEICAIVHRHGGQVYMDGANLNAQVGLCRPADIGADVCHINLHKTFCIPHGGGGPGMGPIAAAAHLQKFLPGHPVIKTGGSDAIGPISAAPWGSASILLISWAYITMMGPDGLTRATTLAILNANYVAERLGAYYPVFYRGKRGRVAHECIFDLRQFKKTAGIEAEDVAKRLMDYGFHAPTMSFPIPGTLMVEPTESEGQAELDRFCEAMIAIRQEIAAIESGEQPSAHNILKNAPHTADVLLTATWDRPYTREQAAFPLPWVRAYKYWPPVGRINNTLGDRNFVCACPPIESYT